MTQASNVLYNQTPLTQTPNIYISYVVCIYLLFSTNFTTNRLDRNKKTLLSVPNTVSLKHWVFFLFSCTRKCNERMRSFFYSIILFSKYLSYQRTNNMKCWKIYSVDFLKKKHISAVSFHQPLYLAIKTSSLHHAKFYVQPLLILDLFE